MRGDAKASVLGYLAGSAMAHKDYDSADRYRKHYVRIRDQVCTDTADKDRCDGIYLARFLDTWCSISGFLSSKKAHKHV